MFKLFKINNSNEYKPSRFLPNYNYLENKIKLNVLLGRGFCAGAYFDLSPKELDELIQFLDESLPTNYSLLKQHTLEWSRPEDCTAYLATDFGLGKFQIRKEYESIDFGITNKKRTSKAYLVVYAIRTKSNVIQKIKYKIMNFIYRTYLRLSA
jgi:hypothetical protein